MGPSLTRLGAGQSCNALAARPRNTGLASVCGYDGPSPVAGSRMSYLPYEPAAVGVASGVQWLPEAIYSCRRGGPDWTCRRSARYEREPWRAAVSSTDDGQGVARRPGVAFTPHRPASPRGHRLQGIGPTHRTSDHLRLSQDNVDALSGLFDGYWRCPAGGAGEAWARGAGPRRSRPTHRSIRR